MKKKMNRRQFAKLAGGAALAVPVAGRAWAQEPAKAPQEAPPKAEELKYGMTKEQEARVKQAVERRERQLAPLRNYKLSYAAEPAFVFAAVKSKGRA